MNTKIVSLSVFIITVMSSCVFDNDDNYTEYHMRYDTILDLPINAIIDNGCYIDEIHIPYSEGATEFMLFESPEMLDSICPGISYSGPDTPHLEDMFPEDVMLLIHNGELCFGSTLESYTLSHDDSLVCIDEIQYSWFGEWDPGLWDRVYVVGIIPR